MGRGYNKHKNRIMNTENLGNKFLDRGMVEIGGVAWVPLAVTLFELEFHEVASDWSEDHVAGLATNRVVELEDPIVAGTTIPYSQALVPR